MKKLRSFRVALAATCLFISCLSAHAAGPAAPAPKAGTPQVRQFGDPSSGFLVKFKPGLSEEQMTAHLATHGLAKGKRFHAPRKAPEAAIGRWWHVSLANPKDAQALRRLMRDGLIERVEANQRVQASAAPNDPQFPAQWGLQNIGQAGGVPGADVKAPAAWDVQTGSPEIIVAVLDTGVDYTHPDLAANIWTNPGEIPGNGADDDGNGHADDVYGFDFYNFRPDPKDDNGHGTHVAGVIGAVGNNGIGVAGVNWQVRIMSVKVLDFSGGGFLSDTISGLHYAVDMGARVVNMSLATDEYSQSLADAVAAAEQAGVLVVAAAGNTATNNDASPRYPAGLTNSNVIAVAATTPADQLASFSNSGPTSVLLGAPGAGIVSTVPATGQVCCRDPSGYKALDGTSEAAAFVSGAAALLLAQDAARTPAQLKRLLWTSSDPVPGLAGRIASGGRLNVANALSCVPGQARLRIISPGSAFKAYSPKTTRISAELASCDSGVAGANVTASFSSGDVPVTLYDDGAHGDGAAGDGIYANDWTPVAAGPVSVIVTAALPGFESTAAISGNVRMLTSYRTEPATYNWIDTSAGTQYVFDALTVVTLPLGFNFNFYNEDRASLTISLNGYVTFDPQPLYAIFWPHKPLPDSFPPNDLISVYGDLMEPGLNTRIQTLFEGAAPERRLTITWDRVLLWDTSTEGTFQMTLYEGSNDIVFRYKDTTFGGQFVDAGATAAVGTEDKDAFEATNWLGTVPDGSALRLYQTSYNFRPVANPGGPYVGLVNHPVTFDGSRSSDQNGDALTYRWRFDPFIIANGTGVSPTFTYTQKGRHVVSLIVNDGTLDSEVATTIVDIPNHAPVANVGGPYSGLGMTLITFNGAGSDIDGDTLSFSYTVRDSSGQTFVPSQGNGGFFFPGTYTVTLVVSDSITQSAPSTTTLTVANSLPTVNAGADITAARGQTVQLAANGQDRDGQIVAYAWRQVSGQAVSLTNATSAQLTFTVPKSFKTGDLVFEVKVTDNLGGQATDQVKVSVTR
jgi:subtilisin family serine protease